MQLGPNCSFYLQEVIVLNPIKVPLTAQIPRETAFNSREMQVYNFSELTPEELKLPSPVSFSIVDHKSII